MIGTDDLNADIILKGLANTDPSLLVDEMNQTKGVNNQTQQVQNQSALLPSEIAKNQSAADYQAAEAAKTRIYIDYYPKMMESGGDATTTIKNRALGIVATPPPAPVGTPNSNDAAMAAAQANANNNYTPPTESLITPNTTSDAVQPSNPINNNDNTNDYSTGLDS